MPPWCNCLIFSLLLMKNPLWASANPDQIKLCPDALFVFYRKELVHFSLIISPFVRLNPAVVAEEQNSLLFQQVFIKILTNLLHWHVFIGLEGLTADDNCKSNPDVCVAMVTPCVRGKKVNRCLAAGRRSGNRWEWLHAWVSARHLQQRRHPRERFGWNLPAAR